jgi:hypothetical protein
VPIRNDYFSIAWLYALLHEMQHVLRDDCCNSALMQQVPRIKDVQNATASRDGQSTIRPHARAPFFRLVVLATRYDKTAESYFGFIPLSSVRLIVALAGLSSG